MKPAPFICSFEARRRIRAFVKEQPGMDVALILCEGGEICDSKGQAAPLEFQGDHFFLKHHPKGHLPEDSFYTLDRERISIGPSVLECLKGKRLVEKCYSFGPRHILTLFFPRYQLPVLTAEPAPGEFIAFEPDGVWHNRPVLEPNEMFLNSFRALQTRGKLMVTGKLFLTSTRLVFAPDRITMDSAICGWQAPRNSIVKVALAGPSRRLRDFLSGAMRTRVAVTTASGQSAFFRADSPAELQRALAAYSETGRAEPDAAANGGATPQLRNTAVAE